MKQYADTPTPAMQAKLAPSRNNLIFRIELDDVYEEPVRWLIVGEPATQPSVLEQLRKMDEATLLPAIFDEEDIYARFAFPTNVVFGLFAEEDDSSLRMVETAIWAPPAEAPLADDSDDDDSDDDENDDENDDDDSDEEGGDSEETE